MSFINDIICRYLAGHFLLWKSQGFESQVRHRNFRLIDYVGNYRYFEKKTEKANGIPFNFCVYYLCSEKSLLLINNLKLKSRHSINIHNDL